MRTTRRKLSSPERKTIQSQQRWKQPQIQCSVTASLCCACCPGFHRHRCRWPCARRCRTFRRTKRWLWFVPETPASRRSPILTNSERCFLPTGFGRPQPRVKPAGLFHQMIGQAETCARSISRKRRQHLSLQLFSRHRQQSNPPSLLLFFSELVGLLVFFLEEWRSIELCTKKERYAVLLSHNSHRSVYWCIKLQIIVG